MNKVIIRNDDVLCPSSAFSDPVERLKKFHRWIVDVPDHVLHVPAILVTEIQEYPEAIEYIQEETAQKRMSPQIHGLTHIDYGGISLDQIRDHLGQCVEWMSNTFEERPTHFMTPWGSNSQDIQKACNELGLIVMDCSKIVKPSNALTHIRRYGLEGLRGRYVLTHWWEQGLRIHRLVMCYKYGGWEQAKSELPKLFS